MLLMREGTGHASSHVGRIASFAYVIGLTCANTALSAHVMQFLNSHGGKSGLFAPVTKIT